MFASEFGRLNLSQAGMSRDWKDQRFRHESLGYFEANFDIYEQQRSACITQASLDKLELIPSNANTASSNPCFPTDRCKLSTDRRDNKCDNIGNNFQREYYDNLQYQLCNQQADPRLTSLMRFWYEIHSFVNVQNRMDASTRRPKNYRHKLCAYTVHLRGTEWAEGLRGLST